MNEKECVSGLILHSFFCTCIASMNFEIRETGRDETMLTRLFLYMYASYA